MSHIDSNRRKPAAQDRRGARTPARLSRPGGLRQFLEKLVHEHQRVRRNHDRRRPQAPKDRSRDASRRCANACRKTGSRCRNGLPASDAPAALAVQADFSAEAPLGRAGLQLPKGVTRAQYEAAIKKCGGGSFAGRGARFNSPAYKAALTKFAACMRENGVNVPAPNTSGSGPIFDTKGLEHGQLAVPHGRVQVPRRAHERVPPPRQRSSQWRILRLTAGGRSCPRPTLPLRGRG